MHSSLRVDGVLPTTFKYLYMSFRFYGRLSCTLERLIASRGRYDYLHEFKRLMQASEVECLRLAYWEVYILLMDLRLLGSIVFVGELQRVWLACIRWQGDTLPTNVRCSFMDATINFSGYIWLLTWVFTQVYSRAKSQAPIGAFIERFLVQRIKRDYFAQRWRDHILDYERLPDRRCILPKRIVRPSSVVEAESTNFRTYQQTLMMCMHIPSR